MKFILNLFIAAAVTLVSIGYAAAQAQDKSPNDEKKSKQPTMPGKMADAGEGVKLHLVGAGKGSPTVILDAGATSMSSQWAHVLPEIARFTGVVAYDCAGLGWSDSDADGVQRSARRNARQLHTALQNAGIKGPYILVGHSLGGHFNRVFAGMYPSEIAGMVLVDPSHPEQMRRLPASSAADSRRFLEMLMAAPELVRKGDMSVTEMLMQSSTGLPAKETAEFRYFLSTPKHLEAVRREMLSWEVMEREVKESRLPEDVPLIVLSAGVSSSAEFVEMFTNLHREIAALSGRGEHRIVKEANHISLATNKEHARSVVQAVRDIYNNLRKSERSVIGKN